MKSKRNITIQLDKDTEVIECEDVLLASEMEEEHRIGFWDALIIAAARKAGAATILSEDLNPGQTLHGVLVKNPFLP